MVYNFVKKMIFLSMLASFGLFAQSRGIEQLVYEIRDPQTGRADFRNAVEKIGEYLALEVFEELEVEEKSIQTLTGAFASHSILIEQPVLVTILRAGLPLNAGVQRVFPDSDVGFLAMSRNEETLKAQTDYIALPNLRNRDVIISDTMLATGGSLIDAIQVIETHHPKQIFVIAAIASEEGILRIFERYPSIKIFAAAVDPMLNERGYIIPGLGDAGDRSYGDKRVTKIEN